MMPRRAAGESPHNEILHQQQMFSFPVACVVFAVLGLALGLNGEELQLREHKVKVKDSSLGDWLEREQAA